MTPFSCSVTIRRTFPQIGVKNWRTDLSSIYWSQLDKPKCINDAFWKKVLFMYLINTIHACTRCHCIIIIVLYMLFVLLGKNTNDYIKICVDGSISDGCDCSAWISSPLLCFVTLRKASSTQRKSLFTSHLFTRIIIPVTSAHSPSISAKPFERSY